MRNLSVFFLHIYKLNNIDRFRIACPSILKLSVKAVNAKPPAPIYLHANTHATQGVGEHNSRYYGDSYTRYVRSPYKVSQVIVTIAILLQNSSPIFVCIYVCVE